MSSSSFVQKKKKKYKKEKGKKYDLVMLKFLIKNDNRFIEIIRDWENT